jgi:hypothetical protein
MASTKRPATAADFARWEEKAKSLPDAFLLSAIRDCMAASKAMAGFDPIAEAWYADEGFTYIDEMNRRKRGTSSKTSRKKK